jgi:membrane-associated phospholipid phosphatase
MSDISQESYSTSNCKPRLSRAVIYFSVLIVALLVIRSNDHTIFRFLNSIHSPISDQFWLCCTTIGDGLLLGICAGLFLFVNPRIPMFAILLMILSALLIHATKAAMPELRPASLLSDAHIIGPVLKYNSFPSGHTAAAFSAAIGIGLYLPVRFRVGLVFTACLVGLSRIFVGAHFPGDVVGGIIASLIVFYAAIMLIWPKIEPRIPAKPNNSRFFRFVWVAELIAIIFAAVIYSWRYAESPWFAFCVSVFVGALFCGLTYRLLRGKAVPLVG